MRSWCISLEHGNRSKVMSNKKGKPSFFFRLKKSKDAHSSQKFILDGIFSSCDVLHKCNHTRLFLQPFDMHVLQYLIVLPTYIRDQKYVGPTNFFVIAHTLLGYAHYTFCISDLIYKYWDVHSLEVFEWVFSFIAQFYYSGFQLIMEHILYKRKCQ